MLQSTHASEAVRKGLSSIPKKRCRVVPKMTPKSPLKGVTVFGNGLFFWGLDADCLPSAPQRAKTPQNHQKSLQNTLEINRNMT